MTLTLRSVGQRLLLIPCAAALVTIGCGEGQILQSPTGPSGTLGSTAFQTVDDADIAATASTAGEFEALGRGGNGNGNGNGGGNGKDKDKGGKKPGDSEDGEGADNGGGPGRSHEAKVVGFVSATGLDSIMVNGILVTAGPGTVIRHGNRHLEMADIVVGDHIVARGAMETTPTGRTFIATEIKVQEQGEDDDDDGTIPPAAPLKGTISGLTPSATGCTPTFTISTTPATTVMTTATTTYDDVTCAALANGNLVEVTGAKRADGVFIATKVELQSGPDEVKGIVSELTGTASCATPAMAALTFKVGPALTATTVKTTPTTTFTGPVGFSCATLANGANVEVEGTKQADGSITAVSVELH
jgi:hypothetical protein